MNTIFMKLENSKIFYSHRILLSFLDEIDLKKSVKYFAVLNLSMYFTWTYIKKIVHKQ